MNMSMTYKIIKKLTKTTYGECINDQLAWEWPELICILIFKKKKERKKKKKEKDNAPQEL